MSKEFKTMVIISPGFPTSESDSTCLPSQQIFVRTLNDAFPHLKIIILALQYPFFKGEYQWYGNTIHSFDGARLNYVDRLVHWFRVYKRLSRIHRIFRIDGMLSFWCAESAFIGKYFSRHHAITHFCWILGQDARQHNRFVRWINPKSEELIALSAFLQKEFYANHNIKPKYLIPNGISTSLFNPTRVPKNIDIIGVGSLIPLKRYATFVDIIHQIKMHIPGVSAMLCGKGPEKSNLTRQIKMLGLEDNIALAGELSHEKILATMSEAKILLHPSSYEGYSTVCLEALYAGCHVVSFWCADETLVNHWHIAADKEDAVQQCLTILQGNNIDYSPVTLHLMEDSVKEIMKLYSHKDASTV